MGRQQTMQREGRALLLREGCSLVQKGIGEERRALELNLYCLRPSHFAPHALLRAARFAHAMYPSPEILGLSLARSAPELRRDQVRHQRIEDKEQAKQPRPH